MWILLAITRYTRLILPAIFMMSTASVLHGQSVRGAVFDGKTQEPLPSANIFINNTTLGTVSDKNGRFELHVPSSGSFELIISYVGYTSVNINILVENDFQDVGRVQLAPIEAELMAVEVRGQRDKIWEGRLTQFKRTFLGTGKEARQCTLLNPWVIDFSEEELGMRLLANAAEVVQIENRFLGYKIFYDLRNFSTTRNFLAPHKEVAYSFNGYVRFEPLIPSNLKEASRWARNREGTYWHSMASFFHAVWSHRIRGEGFRIYTDTRDKKTISSQGDTWDWSASLTRLDTAKLQLRTDASGYSELVLPGLIEVSRQSKGRKLVSQFLVKRDTVYFNSMGFPLNPEAIRVAGDWYHSRVASLLPLDYGIASPNANPLGQPQRNRNHSIALNDVIWFERIYLQTDKPYYYSGEPLWFKGNILYASSRVRDSLSRTVYVDLVSPSKRVLHTRVVKIDSGFFHNDFILPDTLLPGTYYLRAYTNLSRNFGVEGEFVKPIQILSLTDHVDPMLEVREKGADSTLTISFDKKHYGLREQIKATLRVVDQYGVPVEAQLGVSVTDARQVVPIWDSRTVTETSQQEDSVLIGSLRLRFPVEFGLTFQGQFVDNHSRPDSTAIDLMQLNPISFRRENTNKQGQFSFKGITFFDTATFALKSTKSKETAYGKFMVSPRATTEIQLTEKEKEYKLALISSDSPKRLISAYEVPKDAKMLEEVEIKAKRIVPVHPFASRADFILDGDELIHGSNLAASLIAKVPGLSIQLGGTRKDFHSDGSSVEYYDGPVATYFKNPIGIPNDIPASAIQSVLFFRKTSISSAHVDILFKPGNTKIPVPPNFQLIKLMGYHTPRAFRAPDYSNPLTDKDQIDYRATIYWNPTVTTKTASGTAEISFWSADLPTQYRMVVEGITQFGVPVRSVVFVEVGND